MFASKSEGYKAVGILPNPDPKDGQVVAAVDLPDFCRSADKLFDRLNSADLDDEEVWTENFVLRAHKFYKRLKERLDVA